MSVGRLPTIKLSLVQSIRAANGTTTVAPLGSVSVSPEVAQQLVGSTVECEFAQLDTETENAQPVTITELSVKVSS